MIDNFDESRPPASRRSTERQVRPLKPGQAERLKALLRIAEAEKARRARPAAEDVMPPTEPSPVTSEVEEEKVEASLPAVRPEVIETEEKTSPPSSTKVEHDLHALTTGKVLSARDLDRGSLRALLNEEVGTSGPLHESRAFKEALEREVQSRIHWADATSIAQDISKRAAAWETRSPAPKGIVARALSALDVRSKVTDEIQHQKLIERAALAAHRELSADFKTRTNEELSVDGTEKKITYSHNGNGMWSFEIPPELASLAHARSHTGQYRDSKDAIGWLNQYLLKREFVAHAPEEKITRQELDELNTRLVAERGGPPEYKRVDEVLDQYKRNATKFRRRVAFVLTAAAGATAAVAVMPAVAPALAGAGLVSLIATGAVGGSVASMVRSTVDVVRAQRILAKEGTGARLDDPLAYVRNKVLWGAIIGATTAGVLEKTGLREILQKGLQDGFSFLQGIMQSPSVEPPVTLPIRVEPPPVEPPLVAPPVVEPPVAVPLPVEPPPVEPLPVEPTNVPPQVLPPPKISTVEFAFPINESSNVRTVPQALRQLFASAGYDAKSPAVNWLVDAIDKRTYQGYGAQKGTQVLEMMTGLKHLTPTTKPDNASVNLLKYFKSPLAMADLEARINSGMLAPDGNRATNELLREEARKILGSIEAVAQTR